MTPKLNIKSSLDTYISDLVNSFWANGGKEKYEATKEMRAANGIPDSQWMKANLMGIIDDAEITFE